ncbi:unnamed protein product [Phytomonas sp. EM1]|nr:unnamed protein product [Phytomonas sp. EM1]|eukprot:CCW60050.1 unnamed protein product [Phytomonas sp. isolate EM1]
MVTDLFLGRSATGVASPARRGTHSRRGSVVSEARHSDGGTRRRPTHSRDSTSYIDGTAGLKQDGETDFQLLASCAAQVQRNLKTSSNSPSSFHTLASYYTRVTPLIENRPFCVSLSYSTFLFHMQMSRISLSDVDLYVKLITTVLSQMNDTERLRHPFVQQVLRDHVLGLSSPTCRGGAHCVVLLPPQQYRAFATMACNLLELDILPMDITYQFQDKLRSYCNSLSPLVANRALALLVKTVDQVRIDEQVTSLQYVLKTKPTMMNLDFLLACYERLKRAVTDPANGPSFGRALSIHCSELFLRFRSPIRREYVERYLYPSLCHPDMAGFLDTETMRRHLFQELLPMCTSGLSTANPFYMCICALLQSRFDDEIDGAIEIVTLIDSQMPHAAYFMSALAIDTHMSVSMFAKVVIALSRGAGLAMTGHEVPDEVATTINKSRANVYNVLFVLREVVRTCSVTDSRRAVDMLKALRIAVPIKSIEALGKLSTEAFEGHCDIPVDPQLLCAELAMVLHYEHIVEAVESSVEYFTDVSTQCHYCGMQRSVSLICSVNGTMHVVGQTSVSRVLSTLAECAGSKVLVERLIQYMRDPVTQMNSAVHFLIYHIISNAGQHRNTLFVALEPYIRTTLLALVSMERSHNQISSEHKANVLMLHVKLVTLLSSTIDASYLESILKVFAELKLNNNHDALALWYMCNVLLRNCKENIDLLPTDPHENNYCVDFPGCAPRSVTCADNAQMLLKLLDRAHNFSAETRKLVGCCVCRMIQDFNMQAPNIVSALLSSFGFVPIGLDSLNEFALPVGAGSTFWSFFLNQMKTSAPARTALMVALAKSMSRRFRIANPTEAVEPSGGEATGHLFSVMMYEAMKRSPPLARVVLYMISHWMKQSDHLPGKFVCLVYICVQLIIVIVERGEGDASRVEIEAETVQDRMQFDNSVKKAAKLLSTQQSRLEKLAPAVQRENTAFFHLVHRLHRKVCHTIATVNGESVPSFDGSESQQGIGVPKGPKGSSAWQENVEANTTAPLVTESVVNLNELYNAMDDSVFNDFPDEGANFGDSEEDGSVTHHSNMSLPLPAPVSSSTGNTQKNAKDGSFFPQDVTDVVGRHPASSAVNPGDIGRLPSRSMNNTEDGQLGVEPDVNIKPNHATATASMRERLVDTSSGVPTTTTQHLGVNQQSTVNQAVDHLIHRAVSHSVGTSPGLPSHQSDMHSPPGRMVRTYDKAVTAPFMKSSGTSPIQFDGAAGFKMPPEAPNKCSMTLVERDTDGRVSEWVEPGLSEEDQGDVTPIDEIKPPQLQATVLAGSCDGVVLPSGMVLEYLRTHQAMDSLRHELQQLEKNLMDQQMVNYMGPHQEQLSGKAAFPSTSGLQQHQLTVEGRTNNYGGPHQVSNPAPGRTLVAPVHMVETSQVRHMGLARPSGGTTPQQKQFHVQDDGTGLGSDGEEGLGEEVVDGEGPITAVSEDLCAKRVRVEHRPQCVPISSETPSDQYRGVNFFLKQNQANQENVNSALQDIRYMQRQKSGMGSLVEKQHASGAVRPHNTTGAHFSGEEAENVAPSSSPYHTLVSEGLPPTTPFGQIVIPTCFVEQKNDTAVQELRQVMGAHHPNDTRLSLKGKRRIQGSGAFESEETSNGRASAAWWTEMSSAPMPTYAADPQYSMELF